MRMTLIPAVVKAGQKTLQPLPTFLTDLLVHHAVKCEDEGAVEGVEDGEDIGEGERGVGDRHDGKPPGDAQQEQQTQQT